MAGLIIRDINLKYVVIEHMPTNLFWIKRHFGSKSPLTKSFSDPNYAKFAFFIQNSCGISITEKMVLLRQQNLGQQIKILLLQPKILLQQPNVLLTELKILL